MTEFDYYAERPLDRAPGETSQANSALMDYWRMGSGRSLRNLLENYRNQTGIEGESTEPPTRRFATLFGWSSKFKWQERIERAEEHQRAEEARLKQEALKIEAQKWAERRLQVRERDWVQAEALRDLADQIINESPNFLKRKTKFIKGKDGEPDTQIITVAIDAKLMVGAIQAASKLGRLAAEMETDYQSLEVDTAENIQEVRRKRWAEALPALADALDMEDDDQADETGGELDD